MYCSSCSSTAARCRPCTSTWTSTLYLKTTAARSPSWTTPAPIGIPWWATSRTTSPVSRRPLAYYTITTIRVHDHGYAMIVTMIIFIFFQNGTRTVWRKSKTTRRKNGSLNRSGTPFRIHVGAHQNNNNNNTYIIIYYNILSYTQICNLFSIIIITHII